MTFWFNVGSSAKSISNLILILHYEIHFISTNCSAIVFDTTLCMTFSFMGTTTDQIGNVVALNSFVSGGNIPVNTWVQVIILCLLFLNTSYWRFILYLRSLIGHHPAFLLCIGTWKSCDHSYRRICRPNSYCCMYKSASHSSIHLIILLHFLI